LVKRSSENSNGPLEISASKIKVKDKTAIPSFLDKFSFLSEEDLEMLATWEEE